MDGHVKPFFESTLNQIMTQFHQCGKTNTFVTLQKQAHNKTHTPPTSTHILVPYTSFGDHIEQ